MAAKRSNAKSTGPVKKSPGKKASKPAAKKAAKKASKPAAKKASKPAAKKAAKKASKPAAKKAAKKASKPAAKKAAKKASKPAAKQAAQPAKAAAKPAKKAEAPAQVAPPAAAGLAVGDQAPSFELPDQDGNTLTSASLVGAPYIIYFYPKDDTPGCTKEACGFQAEKPAFESAGVRVIGVSPDSPASHTKFRAKYGLEFTLLSDADKQLAEAYGVWVMKQNYGRQYMGIQRSTFLVDAAGKVARSWRNVKVNGHVEAVLGASQA
ncbi:MAG: thioredoxin-dependent thiol peroxidase [Polyangiaceae bacterium]|nr:thioredoxin-dependent thiol peroxidase [Polyangiaceae bacterium]MCB9607036.1 thioredoxin-dependent thiol peroxidase [Polyangiaceae bacterium]